MDIRVAHSLVRFGLGRRGAEPLPVDPAASLMQQLRNPDPTILVVPPSTATGLAALRDDRQNKPEPGQSRSRTVFRRDAAAELANALTTPPPSATPRPT